MRRVAELPATGAGEGSGLPPRGFLPAEEYARIRASVPLACVDALPFRRPPAGGAEVLLIRRTQRSERTGWALVGGRILIDESIAEAARRHLRETLGGGVEIAERSWRVPDEVAEYRRGIPHEDDADGTYDPAQHSVALNYLVELGGEPELGGEALESRWFPLDGLPERGEVVFGQHSLIARLAASIGS